MPRGFTLLELLIVVAIIAVLAVAVVLVLNPAELLKQSRDSIRLSDLATLNSALAYYLAFDTAPSLGSCSATYARCTANGGNTSPLKVRTICTSAATSTAINGTGWVDVNFADLTSPPISKEPIDPVNSSTYYYAYGCVNTASTPNYVYELDAKMESTKYSNGGSADVESKDGGDNPLEYEIGNAPGLAL